MISCFWDGNRLRLFTAAKLGTVHCYSMRDNDKVAHHDHIRVRVHDSQVTLSFPKLLKL